MRVSFPKRGGLHEWLWRAAGNPDRWVREDDHDAAPSDPGAGQDRPALARRGERAVRHGLGCRLLAGRPAARPPGPGRAGHPADRVQPGGPSPREALDYVRAPLFDWRAGTALPASGSASADDLQDLLALHLQQCKDAGGEVFAFGAKFDRNLHKPIDAEFGNTDGLHGIHDIHLNQGNTGPHAGDNGALQDGGLILAHPDRHVGLFLAFQTQRVPTDGRETDTAVAAIAELIHGQTPPAWPPADAGLPGAGAAQPAPATTPATRSS